jgi:pyruvate/2-oxoglutarate dehydrogenase complex dihydrolipoamide dehydrogenase (E3) component
MPQTERFETLVLGGGIGGTYLAWHMARSGRRTAVVERQWIGGSCPNINSLLSKNGSRSAKSPIWTRLPFIECAAAAPVAAHRKAAFRVGPHGLELKSVQYHRRDVSTKTDARSR